ncbi:MAG: OsmC family protein [Chitinophagaceae bacterium]|nr:OsmC family protein [Chitinophagaceae bacterium]
MTAKVLLKDNLRTEMIHVASQSIVETDAPIDNHGNGEKFSPTDLVSSALASCMLTIMGIAANTQKIDIVGTSAEIVKIMESNPRRIGEIKIDIFMPKEKKYSAKEKSILERAALACPVHHSLHPDLKKTISFFWE